MCANGRWRSGTATAVTAGMSRSLISVSLQFDRELQAASLTRCCVPELSRAVSRVRALATTSVCAVSGEGVRTMLRRGDRLPGHLSRAGARCSPESDPVVVHPAREFSVITHRKRIRSIASRETRPNRPGTLLLLPRAPQATIFSTRSLRCRSYAANAASIDAADQLSGESDCVLNRHRGALSRGRRRSVRCVADETACLDARPGRGPGHACCPRTVRARRPRSTRPPARRRLRKGERAVGARRLRSSRHVRPA